MKCNVLQTKENNKGFTLVEIIVVLVILAILAAFTIPAMLGFVEDARGKADIEEAREIYTAMQTALTEYASQATNANPLVATDYYYGLQNDTKTGVLVPNIWPQNSVEGKDVLDKLVGTKALNLLNNDVSLQKNKSLGNKNRYNHANITVDVKTIKITKIVLYNDGYIITLDPINGDTKTEKDQNAPN